MDFGVKARTVNEIGVVDLLGEVDVYTTPRAKETMLALLEQGVVRIVVNLAQTEYLDSTALGALVGVLKRARERGGEVRLAGPSARLLRLLEITGLIQVFPVDEDEAHAIAAFEAEGAKK
jgi:anti-sigma B factor antagonist